MAVQQNKKSPSKRGMHRAHDFLTARRWQLSLPPGSSPASPHQPSGYYRGKKVVKTKAD